MSEKHRKIDPARVLPVILLLLPCLLLWRVVFLHQIFLPADLLQDVAPWRRPGTASLIPWVPLQWDGIAEFYPWRLFAARTIHQGYLPLWNPYQFCGTPFVANSQSAVFYPLNLLFVLLPVQAAFGVSTWLHLVLTGCLMYGFLRSPALRLRRSAATLGAVVWQLSTWQVVWLALPTFLCVSAWLPLALWLADRLAIRPTVAPATALGACLGVMLLGGHLQIALYCLLLTAAYGLFRSLPSVHGDRTRLLQTVAAGLLSMALMAAIAAPQVLPTLELSHMSHRAGAAPSWASYAGYTALAMPAISLVTLWLPGFFGSPTLGTYWGLGTNGGPSAFMENACYLGVLGLLFALTAVVSTWRTRPETRFFMIAAFVSLLMALGTPVDALLYFGIPGFAQSGSPGRILVLWTFCGAALAAIGFDALVRRQVAVGLPLLQAVGVFLALFVLSLAGTVFWIGHNSPPGTLQTNLVREHDLWRLPVGLLFGTAAVLTLWQRGSLSVRASQGSLIVLAALDLLAVNVGFNRTSISASVYPVTPAIAFLQQHAGDWRVMPLNRSWSLYRPPEVVLPPNAAIVYGIRDTQGYDSLLTRQYIDWAARLDGGPPAPPENGNMVFTYTAAAPLASAAGVRYFVSRGPLPANPAQYTLAYQEGDTCIYENRGVMPRARLLGGSGPVALSDVAPTRLRVTASNRAIPGIEVADQWYPGWRAWVDGQQATVDKGPEVFRTVHWAQQEAQARNETVTVEMRYLPTSFSLGLFGLCTAMGFVSAVVVYRTVKRPSDRRSGGR